MGATGQAITATGATITLDSTKPVTSIFKHLIAVFTEVTHVVSHCQVPQPQDFWDMNIFWAR
jgi:hypothetical protein